MFILLLACTAGVGLVAMGVAYARSRDPFHPLLITCPIALFLYAVIPAVLLGETELSAFLPLSDLARVQSVFLVLLAAFCVGCGLASGRARWSVSRPPLTLSSAASGRLFKAGVVLGTAGVAIWIALIDARGGLGEVYAAPYGGDVLHEWGWLREGPRLSLVGIVLCLAAGSDGHRWRPWVALLFAIPHLTHVVLGARRGPAFVTLVLVVVGACLFRGRRPPMLATMSGGLVVGLALILIFLNRPRLYLGSDEPLDFDITRSMVFNPGEGNEYVVAAGFILAADRLGRFGWGLSYAEQLFVRPVPRAILPEKYEILQETTVGPTAVASVLGWHVNFGSPPTLFSDLYIEFWWFSALASGLLGALYGWTWRRSVESPSVGWLVLQVFMTQGLLHLLTQGVPAMVVPFIMMFGTSWLVLRWTLDRPFRDVPPCLEWRAPAAPPGPAAADR